MSAVEGLRVLAAHGFGRPAAREQWVTGLGGFGGVKARAPKRVGKVRGWLASGHSGTVPGALRG